MTTVASRFERNRSEPLRYVSPPTDSPSSDGTPPPSPGPSARGSAGGAGGEAEGLATRAYYAALIARVQQVCEGYKAGELAEKMGLHPETVRRYLRGQKPAPEFLAGICRVLDVSPEWLLLGKGDRRSHS